jgi:regulatory protein
MPRPPRRPIDAARLRRAAEHHLERWSTTRAGLRRVLLARVDASVAAHGGDRAALARAVEDLLDHLVRIRAVDDRAWARDRARGLVRKGASVARIRGALAEKGVARAIVDEVLSELEAELGDPTRVAAARYVRKRRLGPYRDPATRSAHRDQDLARLGRRGFPWNVARELVDLPDIPAIEALIR